MTRFAKRGRQREPARVVHLIMVDAVLAVIISTATAGIALSSRATSPHHAPTWIVVVVSVLIGLPVVYRRNWPMPVFGIVFAASLASTLFGISHDPYVSAALVLYTVAASEPPRRTGSILVGVWLATAVVITITVAIHDRQDWPSAGVLFVLILAISGTAWTLGRAVWLQHDHSAKLAEQRTRQVLTEERLHIARELHDIVAHNISLIAVKAAVANHVADTHPQEAGSALRMIETTSRQTLDDLRRVLGVLRSETEDTTDERAPVPGLDDLPTLAEQVTRAGVRVDLDVRCETEPPAATALTAYRIAQEALTNVVKHADAGRCQVTVHSDGESLHITVIDDGRGRPTARAPDRLAGGHGLIGIRERVAIHGGTCTAAPLDAGGFQVSANLPYHDARTGAVP